MVPKKVKDEFAGENAETPEEFNYSAKRLQKTYALSEKTELTGKD